MKKTLITAILAAGFTLAPSPPAAADPTVMTVWDADDDPTLAAQATDAVLQVAQQFPEIAGNVAVGSGPTGPTSYAYARRIPGEPVIIVIKEQWMSDPLGLDQAVREEARTGFSPPLGQCTPIQYLALHEAAHVVSFAHGQAGDYTLARLYGDGEQLAGLISDYSFYEDGTLFPAEALAEAFASVVCNGGNPTEQELAQYITGG